VILVNKLVLFIAQGFGAGRIPVAPGTFGSLVGIGWFLLLLRPGSLLFFVAGTAAGGALSVWLCGLAENLLRKKDPGSVVLDEVAAMPLAFAGWTCLYIAKHAALPSPSHFFRRETWLLTLATFALFRFFDIYKPWPVRQSQSLPGGWGVTVDDFLAALYTAVISGLLAAWLPGLP
jgi:phosphatidylglycerophosphatase A